MTIYEFFRDFSTPLATVIAAGAAAWITFRFNSKQTEIAQSQADIALEKLKFDLFERRMNTYDAIREVIGEIVRTGVVTNQSSNAFIRAIDKVEFLFGPEVKSYLDNLYKIILQYHAVGATIESLADAQRSKAIDAQARRFEQIAAFYIDFPKLLDPYVRMLRLEPRSGSSPRKTTFRLFPGSIERQAFIALDVLRMIESALPFCLEEISVWYGCRAAGAAISTSGRARRSLPRAWHSARVRNLARNERGRRGHFRLFGEGCVKNRPALKTD